MADTQGFARLDSDRMVTSRSGAIALPQTAEAAPFRTNDKARPAPLGGRLKRAGDILVSGVLLFLLAPLLLSVAALVKFTSAGPVIFWSERVGRNGAIFRMPKFRTMQPGAPVRPREGFVEGESYLTPVGAFLRRSSLDELPQLFSVLAGDMSVIGPRPLLPSDPAAKARALLRTPLSARPGVTGLAQIRGRNLVTPKNKARYDAFYTRRWAPALDVWILAVTVSRVVTGKDIL